MPDEGAHMIPPPLPMRSCRHTDDVTLMTSHTPRPDGGAQREPVSGILKCK
jgi:hypothetical protein